LKRLSILQGKSGAHWLGAALICAALPASAADQLTVISFGRADRAALAAAYIDPFAKASGIAVQSLSYDGQITELTQMVGAGATVWDVMQVESRTLQQGCRQGLFEKLDRCGDFHVGASPGLFRPTPGGAAVLGRLLGYP
jgi:putative spermidine/putrescine transport system substrate-binding protein